MSLSDMRVVLRNWFRYYQQLEKQGLTTESDRELVGELVFNLFYEYVLFILTRTPLIFHHILLDI